MQFVVQSEIKLSSAECHVHPGAAGSAVALLFLPLECVINTSSSPGCRVGSTLGRGMQLLWKQ